MDNMIIFLQINDVTCEYYIATKYIDISWILLKSASAGRIQV